MNKFFEQLPQRIVKSGFDPAEDDFILYVRLARKKLNMDRLTLAQKSGIQPEVLASLENHLLYPGELTEEICIKLELALGISYQKFWEANQFALRKL